MERKPTLSEFFTSTFIPLWIDGKQLDDKTKASYRESMAWWLKLTADVPVDQITDLILAAFVSDLSKQPGKKAECLASSSVLKHCRQVDTILKMTGPRSRHNRKGQGILLAEPPFLEAPRVDYEPPCKDWSIEEVRAMYGAADQVKHPKVDGITPGDWWRCYIVLAYFSGLRIFATTNVEFSMVHGTFINVPARLSKRRKGKKQYLHPEVLEHIARIQRPDRACIVPWPNWKTCKRYAYERLNQLQAAAGLPEARWFGFQSFRKTHVTILAGLSIESDQALRTAQQSAGHANLGVTLGHYVSGSMQDRLVASAIDRMPSPCVRTVELPPKPVDERNAQRCYARSSDFID